MYGVVSIDTVRVIKCVNNEICMCRGIILSIVNDRFATIADVSISREHSALILDSWMVRAEVVYLTTPPWIDVIITIDGGRCVVVHGDVHTRVRPHHRGLEYEFEVFLRGRTMSKIPKHLNDLFKLRKVRKLGVARAMHMRWVWMRSRTLLELARRIMLTCCEAYRVLDHDEYV